MINTNHLEPFDYVKDDKDWIYLVKGYLPHNRNLIGAPIYSPAPNRKKTKNVRLVTESSKVEKSILSTGNDMELGLDCIKKHYKRPGPFKIETSEENDIAINALVMIAGELKCELRLFGSRRLDIHHLYSDWDFLILGCSNPKNFVTKLIKTGHARAFCKSEIETRVQRYKDSEGWTTSIVLQEIFSQTTLYVKTASGELGLFFLGRTPFYLNLITDDIKYHSITGIPQRNQGLSFSMPREISVMSRKQIHTIRSVSWSLCGLELCEKTIFEFNGLVSIGHNEWWFGLKHSNIKIL